MLMISYTHNSEADFQSSCSLLLSLTILPSSLDKSVQTCLAGILERFRHRWGLEFEV